MKRLPQEKKCYNIFIKINNISDCYDFFGQKDSSSSRCLKFGLNAIHFLEYGENVSYDKIFIK